MAGPPCDLTGLASTCHSRTRSCGRRCHSPAVARRRTRNRPRGRTRPTRTCNTHSRQGDIRLTQNCRCCTTFWNQQGLVFLWLFLYGQITRALPTVFLILKCTNTQILF